MLRFRFFLPLMAPVLVVFGWWWYTSRKKKEMAAPEEGEDTAIHEVLNGTVATSRAGLKVVEGNTVGLVEENHILLATAEMLSQSLARETFGRVDMTSHTHHRSLAMCPDAVCLEAFAQGMSDEQATPPLPNTGTDEAEEAETRVSAQLSLPDDEQVFDDSESGTREELAGEPAVVTEEKQSLALPPPHSPGTAISLLPAASTKLETDRHMEPESITVTFLEKLPVLKDQTSQSTTPEALCPEVVMASCHITTTLAPLSNMEAEGPPQQNCHGVPLQRNLVVESTTEEGNGPAPSVNDELTPVATQEELMVRLCDATKDDNGSSSQPSNSFPLSSEPHCTVVDQVVQDIRQTSMEVLCHPKEGWVEDLTEQMSNEMQSPVNDCSSLLTSIDLARNEVVPQACITLIAQEQVEEDRNNGTENRQENLIPVDSPSSLGEPQADDVEGTVDSGCSTGQLEVSLVCQYESTGVEVDRMQSDKSSRCGLNTQTEMLCTAPDQVEQEDRMQHLLQEHSYSETPAKAAGEEASQNVLSSHPIQEMVADDTGSHSRTASLQKSLSLEVTPLSWDKSQKEDVTGAEDSGSITFLSGDGAEASSQEHIPSDTVLEAKQNLVATSAMSQDSEGHSHNLERNSEPSLEEDHQGTVCTGERDNNAALLNGSHIVCKMEKDHSGGESQQTSIGDYALYVHCLTHSSARY